MRRAQKLAAGIAAAMVVSAMSASVSFAANNAFGIDEINWTDEDWASIAMTNDDTVDTGAVIRTKADADSEAAGYLYRGAAVQVVDKGEEWTEVRSGRVTGYVKNEFLAYGDDARGLAAHYGKQGIVANWNDVNVFSNSNADSEVAAQVKDGTPMSMVQDNGHWIAVQSGADSAGFVSEEDVTRVLLVDTAVPANGEDDADVPATMTAADLPNQEPAPEEPAMEAASYEEAPAETYVEPAEQVSYAEDTTAYTAETAAQEPAPASNLLSTQSVSDNAQIQALYDAYIEAYNAAMTPTSEEDAKTKADAAIAAWNAYLAACGEAPATAATQTTATAAATTTEQSTATATETTQQTEAPVAQTEAAQAQTEAPAQTQTTSSSGSAYGSYSDLDLLAAIIWCEAGNQPYDGMVAVGQVVMNRVKSPNYPNTISEVLNQPGQFTPASAGTLQASLAAGVNANCYAAAQDAMNGAAPVPGYPLYFNTHSGSYKLGAHYFS